MLASLARRGVSPPYDAAFQGKWDARREKLEAVAAVARSCSGDGEALKNQLLTAVDSSMTDGTTLYRIQNRAGWKLRLVMLDWLGAPTWHFARSILNATAGHSNSRSLGPDFEIDESGGIGA